MEDKATVFLIDDDPINLDWMATLLRSQGLGSETFESAEQFLERHDRRAVGCVVTDLRMAGMSGLDLMERLRLEKSSLPVVLFTAFGDVPTAVEAMRAGAVTFLQKPCDEKDLFRSVTEAIDRHRGTLDMQKRCAEMEAAFARLTPGELLVLDRMVAGKPNKAIASELQIGLRTVELRRSNVMKKVEVESLAELVCKYMEYRHLLGEPSGEGGQHA